MKPQLTSAKELRKLLEYNPETGLWRWRVRRRNQYFERDWFPGTLNGHDNYRYYTIMINQHSYPVSVLAWFYMTGEWKKGQIDHKDVNSLNNRWDNLREATSSQNHYNTRVRRDNNLGVKWVSLFNTKYKTYYRVSIRNHTVRYFKLFKTLEEAKTNAKEMALSLHGEFARFE